MKPYMGASSASLSLSNTSELVHLDPLRLCTWSNIILHLWHHNYSDCISIAMSLDNWTHSQGILMHVGINSLSRNSFTDVFVKVSTNPPSKDLNTNPLGEPMTTAGSWTAYTPWWKDHTHSLLLIIFITHVLRAVLIPHESISESSPDSPSSMQFLQVMPLQFWHAEMHLTSFFLQLYRQLLQSPLQLQLMNFKSSSAAIGSNVETVS